MEGSKNLDIQIVIKKCNAPEMQSDIVRKMKIVTDILSILCRNVILEKSLGWGEREKLESKRASSGGGRMVELGDNLRKQASFHNTNTGFPTE